MHGAAVAQLPASGVVLLCTAAGQQLSVSWQKLPRKRRLGPSLEFCRRAPKVVCVATPEIASRQQGWTIVWTLWKGFGVLWTKGCVLDEAVLVVTSTNAALLPSGKLVFKTLLAASFLIFPLFFNILFIVFPGIAVFGLLELSH